MGEYVGEIIGGVVALVVALVAAALIAIWTILWRRMSRRTSNDKVGDNPFPLTPDYPSPPPNYIVPDIFKDAKTSLLSSDTASVGLVGAPVSAALHGRPGVGKSALAAALVSDPEVQKRYRDGIVWLEVGRGKKPEDLLRDALNRIRVRDPWETLSDGRSLLVTATADRKMLFVLDDVWDREVAAPFTRLLAENGVMVTTRVSDAITGFVAQPIEVDRLSPEQAVMLLSGCRESGRAGEFVLGEVATECGRVPVALLMARGMVENGREWSWVLERLRESDVTALAAQLPDYEHSDLLSALQVSIDDLAETNPDAYRCFLDCVVFGEDVPVSEGAFTRLWQDRIAAPRVGPTADLLVNRHFVDRDAGRYRFHDLFYDYLQTLERQNDDEIPALHRRLADAYHDACAGDWSRLEDDGYFLDNLVSHVFKGHDIDAARDLVLDAEWVKVKLRKRGPSHYSRDCQVIAGDRAAMRMARLTELVSNTLSRDLGQLAGQLLARAAVDDQDLGETLEPIRDGAGPHEVLPARPFLPGPDSPLRRVLEGHTGPLMAVAALGDGRVVSGSDDNTLRVWDIESGDSEVLEGHTGSVTAVAALGDGRMVSGSSDNTLRVWDIESGDSEVLKGHTGPVMAVAALGDGRVVSGSFDNTLRVWDIESGDSEVLEGHTGWVMAVAALGDGRVVSGSSDNTLRVWDLESGDSEVLEGHTGWVMAVAALGDGRMVSGSSDNTLRVWDLESGDSEVLEGHTDWVRAVAALGDGRVVSGSFDNTLRVWDIESGDSEVLEGHTGWVMAVAALGDGRMVSGSSDNTLRVWDIESGDQLSVFEHGGSIRSISVLRNTNRPVAGLSDGRIALLDVKSDKRD